MDILMRNVDPALVKELDRRIAELSKESKKNFSRNDYLKLLLQNILEDRMETPQPDKLDRQLEALDQRMDDLSELVELMCNTNSQLILILTGGTEIEGDED